VRTKVSRVLEPLVDDPTKDIASLSTNVQAIVDDLTGAISGGLLINDGNLPFILYRASVTSGTAFETAGYGAAIVFSSSKVTGFFHKQLKSNLLQCTMTFDGATSDVILLIIKEPI